MSVVVSVVVASIVIAVGALGEDGVHYALHRARPQHWRHAVGDELCQQLSFLPGGVESDDDRIARGTHLRQGEKHEARGGVESSAA